MVYVRKYLDEDFNDVKRIIDDGFSTNVTKIISTSNSFSLVAISNDKIVGHIRVDCLYDTFKNSNYFVLDYICVDENYRRLGIGKLLIDEVVKIGIENDISYVMFSSLLDNSFIEHVYEKYGFVKDDKYVFRREL